MIPTDLMGSWIANNNQSSPELHVLGDRIKFRTLYGGLHELKYAGGYFIMDNKLPFCDIHHLRYMIEQNYRKDFTVDIGELNLNF